MDPLYAPIPEHSSKNRRFNRLITREGGHMNIKHKGVSWWFLYKADSYRLILNLPWFPMLMVSFVLYSICIVVFASLYYIRLDEIHGAENFMDAVFFSLQTMNTIGYGFLYPTGFYSHFLTFVQSWVGIITFGALTALVFAKLSRPARLRHTIDFSANAIINDVDGLKISRRSKAVNDKPGTRFLSLRLANIRKRQVCTAQLRLLLLKKVSDEECITVMTSMTKKNNQRSEEDFDDYKINITENNDENNYLTDDFANKQKKKMIGSHRSSTDADLPPVIDQPQWKLIDLTYDICDRQDSVSSYMTTPTLAFPWHIVHTIDETSPLYNMTRESMRENDVEVIALLEGIDELTSATFQARWSYKADEILWNRRFVDMVSRDQRGKFVIDFARISMTVPLNTGVSSKAQREATKEKPVAWRRSIPNQDEDHNNNFNKESRSSYTEFNPRSFGKSTLVRNPQLNINEGPEDASELFLN